MASKRGASPSNLASMASKRGSSPSNLASMASKRGSSPSNLASMASRGSSPSNLASMASKRGSSPANFASNFASMVFRVVSKVWTASSRSRLVTMRSASSLPRARVNPSAWRGSNPAFLRRSANFSVSITVAFMVLPHWWSVQDHDGSSLCTTLCEIDPDRCANGLKTRGTPPTLVAFDRPTDAKMC